MSEVGNEPIMHQPAAVPRHRQKKRSHEDENIFDLVANGGANRSSSQQSLHRLNLNGNKSKNMDLHRERMAASREEDIHMERNLALNSNSLHNLHREVPSYIEPLTTSKRRLHSNDPTAQPSR